MSFLELAKQVEARLREASPGYTVDAANAESGINRVNSVNRVATTYSSYAFPWPDALPGLGSRGVGPFDRCACGIGSWVRYGDVVFCLACAKARI